MTPAEIQSALHDPFDPSSVGWKPQAAKGNRALAVAYIDARDVMDRLDDVVGVGAWQDEYQVLPDGSVLCHLRVRLDGEWVTKSDVGGMSEQPDAGDRLKAAFSDALKRAAVKFGIGRYLYSLPSVWCDYDPQKKQFAGTPPLPPWALPGGGGRLPRANAAVRPARQQQRTTSPPTQTQQPAKPQQPPARTPRELWERMVASAPTTGKELFAWLESVEKTLKGMASQPAWNVFDGVMSLLRVGTDQDIKGVTQAKDIEAAWNNAKNFVKTQADLTPAAR